MFASFSEFKFFQSIRIPVESVDDIRFQVEKSIGNGKWEYVQDALLVDVSATGLGFSSVDKLERGSDLRIFINFKRVKIEIEGIVVRSFSRSIHDENLIYGIEVDRDDQANMQRFLEQYVLSFNVDRMRDCLVQLALTERYARASEGFEMFSLILSLFKDMTNFGEKKEFIETMLEEVTRVLNAQRASIFLINPDTNELEAYAALGADKEVLKFDYRKGIAGSVFTTGISLNIDVQKDGMRYSKEFDGITGFKTKSIICSPLHNREDKVIGVIEVLNKRSENRFNMEDEKTMKVLALIFSSVFHGFNPISEQSKIRNFSMPYDRDHVLIGKSPYVKDLRSAIVKLKDLAAPLFVSGEPGTGKQLMSKIIHQEGARGLNPYMVVECAGKSEQQWRSLLFEKDKILEKCKGGTVFFHEISHMPVAIQKELMALIKKGHIEDSEYTLDWRLVASSTHDLRKWTVEGRFDLEFFEYISVSYIYMEPLRKHREDIYEMVQYFLKKECKKQGLLLKMFSPTVMDTFHNHDWPGNVAELRESIEKSVLYNPKVHLISNIKNGATPIIDRRRSVVGSFSDVGHLDNDELSLKDKMALIEREIIISEIKHCDGNKSAAAKKMGISREALRKKLLASDCILEQISGEQKKAA